MERRTLEQQDVHLWLAGCDITLDSNQYKRSVLGGYCDTPGQALQFVQGTHGKPALRPAATTAAPPQFNLSHSGAWRVLAVSGGAPVGVDIQHTVTRQDEMKLARRFFSAAEVEALALLPQERRAHRFYDLWALKEAAVKARGEALPPQLSKRCFSISAGKPTATPPVLYALHETHPDPAYYVLYAPSPGYRLALCLLSDAGPLPQIRMFRKGPSGDIELPLPEPLAISAVQRWQGLPVTMHPLD